MNNYLIKDTHLDLLKLKIFLRDYVYKNAYLMDKLITFIEEYVKTYGLSCNCWHNVDSNLIILDFGKTKSVTVKRMIYEKYINEMIKSFLLSTEVQNHIKSLNPEQDILNTYDLVLINDQYTPNVVSMLYDTTMVHNLINIYL